MYKKLTRSTIRLLQGSVLGFGAPIGWMCIKWFFYNTTPYQFIMNESILFLYLLLGTVFVFSLFGYLLGLSEDKLSYLSFYDQLTKLSNRHYFMEQLRKAFEVAQTRKKPLSVLYLDVDNFKQINDQFGHTVGDLVLTEIGHRLQETLRKEDIAARLGGEEFGIIIADANFEVTKKIAERILYTIRALHLKSPESKNLTVTISIGICCYKTEKRFESLLNNADKALYQAKQTGKNKIVVYSHTE